MQINEQPDSISSAGRKCRENETKRAFVIACEGASGA